MICHWMPSSTPSRTGSAIHGHHPSSPWFKVVSPPSGSFVPGSKPVAQHPQRESGAVQRILGKAARI